MGQSTTSCKFSKFRSMWVRSSREEERKKLFMERSSNLIEWVIHLVIINISKNFVRLSKEFEGTQQIVNFCEKCESYV